MTVPEYKLWLKGEQPKPVFTPELYERPNLQQAVCIPTGVTQLLTDGLTSTLPFPALGGPVTLLITPRPAERPRFSQHLKGAYNSKSYSEYKKRLVELLKAKITEGAIALPADYASVMVDFYLPVPKSWTKRRKAAAYGTLHRSKPDADNYLKAICDAMTEAEVFADDGQVAVMVARKWYVQEDAAPRLEFELHTLDQILNHPL